MTHRRATLIVAFAAVLAAFMILIGEARSQGKCGKRADILAALESQYGEVPVAMGIVTQSNNLLEIIASKEKRTWTLIVTYPGRESRTCVLSSGDGWRMLPWTVPRISA